MVVVLLDPFEPDRPGALGAALLGLTAGEVLFQDGGGDDADLVGAARQFLESDALLQALDALDVGDFLAIDLDKHLRERIVLPLGQLANGLLAN